MRVYLMHAIILIPLACGVEAKRAETSLDPPPVVIVSIDRLDRNGFANMFARLSDCKPAAVGVMELFQETDSTDEAISESMAKLGNVVLATIVPGDSVIKSNREISKNAAGDGFVQFALLEGRVVGHWMLHDHQGGALWSFPLSVLAQYDMVKTEEIFEASVGDIVYRISFDYSPVSFQILDGSENIDCNFLDGKIVLVGYTGFESEKYLVEVSDEVVEMSITVAMANTILHLMKSKKLEEIR